MFVAMRPMLERLEANPDKGLLGARLAWIGGPAVVQYWRSFEQLERFARSPDRNIRDTGDVGIWHETYKVRAAEYEAIYGNMPRTGLAAAARHVPIGSKGRSAARRIGATVEDRPAVADPGYASERTA